ncbi:MAG: hypothetical protein NVSMB18_08610 [Acetobacteraceae bacterium]
MTLDQFIPSTQSYPFNTQGRFSPLVLADRLITLAQEADREGFRETASGLVSLVFSVLDRGPHHRS